MGAPVLQQLVAARSSFLSGTYSTSSPSTARGTTPVPQLCIQAQSGGKQRGPRRNLKGGSQPKPKDTFASRSGGGLRQVAPPVTPQVPEGGVLPLDSALEDTLHSTMGNMVAAVSAGSSTGVSSLSLAVEVADPVPSAPSQPSLLAYYTEGLSGDEELAVPLYPVTLEGLATLGVLYMHFDTQSPKCNVEVDCERNMRGLTKSQTVTMDVKEECPQRKNFSREHMQIGAEACFLQEGSGWFDVRDLDDRWIRLHAYAGDMLIFPAGIYKRYTVDSSGSMTFHRFFTDSADVEPFYRPQEGHPARQAYLASHGLINNSWGWEVGSFSDRPFSRMGGWGGHGGWSP